MLVVVALLREVVLAEQEEVVQVVVLGALLAE